MVNEEINRLIHVEIMGECWHEYDYSQKYENQIDRYKCIHCGHNGWGSPTNGVAGFDYTNDLNAVAKAEAKVIAEKGKAAYMNALLDCFPANPVVTQEDLEWDCDLATAPASVRCAALLKTREK